MPLHNLLKIILFASIILIPHVSSAQPNSIKLNQDERKALQRIEVYLNEMKTLRADFLQVSSNGAVATGKLLLQRPGKIRFEYDPPSPIMLIADGYFLRYVDKDLEQVTHIWLEDTPIGFLLEDDLKLSGSITVTKFSRNANLLTATLARSKEPEKGTVSLIFSDRPLGLKKWVIKDAQGITTTITLNNRERPMKIDPALFELNSQTKPK
jgi:outer membrane lipoprotein-sorting protein